MMEHFENHLEKQKEQSHQGSRARDFIKDGNCGTSQVAQLRRTSSENALAQRWQAEKDLPDFLSKTTEQRILREKWYRFLKEEKEVLEGREKSLKREIRLWLEKYSKKQVLENRQRSLEIALLPLDSTKLKGDMTEYSKELESYFQSKCTQMKEIEKRLQENKEQFEQVREEEKKISGDFFLRELTTDENIRYRDVIHAQLINHNRAHDGYLFYDHTVIVKYAELEKKEIYENIIMLIKKKHLLKEHIINNLNIINDKKLESIMNIIDEKEAYETYQCVKRAETEKWKANSDYDKAYEAYKECKDDYDKLPTACKKLAKASGIRDDATKEQALAEEKLEMAERKLRDHYEPLLKALQDEQMRFQETKWSLDGPKEYSEAIMKIQDEYKKYDEALEKVKQAEVLSGKIKGVIDEYKHLSHDQKKTHEEIQMTKERLAEIKTYQHLKEDLKQVQKQKKKISVAIDTASRELSQAKMQEEEAKEFNRLLKKPAQAGIELYQDLDRVGTCLIEKEKELKEKEKEFLRLQNSLIRAENEDNQVKNNLENKKMALEKLEMDLENVLKQHDSLERKKIDIRENQLRNKYKNDEVIKELTFLQERIREIENAKEYGDFVVEKYIKELKDLHTQMPIIKELGYRIMEYSKIIQNYENDSDKTILTENSKQHIDKLKITLRKSIDELKNEKRKIGKISEYTYNLDRSIEIDIRHLNLEKNELKFNIYKKAIITLLESAFMTCAYIFIEKKYKELYDNTIKPEPYRASILAVFAVGISRHFMREFEKYKEKVGNIDKNILNKRKETLEQKIGNFVSHCDEAIKLGLNLQNVAKKLEEFEKQRYSEKKTRLLEGITREMRAQNDKKIGLQSNLERINQEIASEERNLSSKKQKSQTLQNKFNDICLETKWLAEKIDGQKKKKEKVCNEIKDLRLLVARAMRLKEKVANLALEKTVQLYGLILPDTKVPRVSPTPLRTKGQEIVTHETPRAIQEVPVFPRQQAGPLAPGEQEKDFASESDSDDEFSILL